MFWFIVMAILGYFGTATIRLIGAMIRIDDDKEKTLAWERDHPYHFISKWADDLDSEDQGGVILLGFAVMAAVIVSAILMVVGKLAFFSSVTILGFEQDPFVLFLLRADQMPLTAELSTIEDDLELPIGEFLDAVLILGEYVAPAVPDHHRPGTVGIFGDDAFEMLVLERVILGADGESLD